MEFTGQFIVFSYYIIIEFINDVIIYYLGDCLYVVTYFHLLNFNVTESTTEFHTNAHIELFAEIHSESIIEPLTNPHDESNTKSLTGKYNELYTEALTDLLFDLPMSIYIVFKRCCPYLNIFLYICKCHSKYF